MFVKDSINEYLDGTTAYAEVQKPVTLHDLPTLVLCHEQGIGDEQAGIYGQDFSIEFSIDDGSGSTGKDHMMVIKLEENVGSIETLFGITLGYGRFYKASQSHFEGCHKISFTWNGKGSTDVKTVTLGLNFAISGTSFIQKFENLNVAFTSDQNSYGAALGLATNSIFFCFLIVKNH